MRYPVPGVSLSFTQRSIRRTGISAIGFRETAEKGKVSDYFVAKKEGVNGMPAPVKIFFPEGGGEPKISYVGSL